MRPVRQQRDTNDGFQPLGGGRRGRGKSWPRRSLAACLALTAAAWGQVGGREAGPGTNPYAGAGLYELPGAPAAEDPWIVEVGFELEGLKENDVRLQVSHEPVPSLRMGETSLVGFVRMGGGRHFVELTQPPADPQRRTRRFWYTRVLRL